MRIPRRRVWTSLALMLSIGVLHAAKLPSPGTVVTAGDHDYSMTYNGRDRDFRVYVPKGYNDKTQLPLLIALHGGFGTGPDFEDQTGFDKLADAHHFLIAYPDGWRRSWNAGSCCWPASSNNIDDVGFIAALKARLLKHFAIDPSRVYGTGFSNGAMLAHRISCQDPDTFAAIAAVEGGTMVKSCNTSVPMPTLIIGGLKDERIPWHGGKFHGTFRPSAQTMVDRTAKRNSCTGKTKVTYNANQVLCRERSDCGSGDAVAWCRIDNGGHQWAGGKTYLEFMLGPNNEKFSDSQAVWNFVSRFRRPVKK